MGVMLALATLALAAMILIRRGESLSMRWRPTRHSVVAVATAIAAFGLSASLRFFDDRSSLWPQVIQYVLLYVGCGFVIPWGYTLFVAKLGPAAMGLTRERWRRSLAMNLGLGAFFALVMIGEARERGIDLGAIPADQFAGASFVLLMGLAFELFLYFGFLHMQLERDLGPIPAVLLTSALYVLWHVGTQLPFEPEPLAAMAKLFLVGVMYQSVFSIGRNLLAVWPFFALAGVLIDFAVNITSLQRMVPALPGALTTLILMATLGMVFAFRYGERNPS
jgi:membrane protease YdiL (CAAX protease family)